MGWTLHFNGVGNASAVELGSAMGTIEREGRPWLAIDCGGEGLTAFQHRYGEAPAAVFITHAHLDHIAGLERLFVSSYFDEARRGRTRLYVPAPPGPLRRPGGASYPTVLAEGGGNFWDPFQLVPVDTAFWHDGQRLEVFPVRHHWPDTAFGLRLPGSVVWTGDTRPIPEQLARVAAADELIAHDCVLHGNPSHSGIDDLEREYPPTLLARCVLYHYASAADGVALAARGHRIARPLDTLALNDPRASGSDCT